MGQEYYLMKTFKIAAATAVLALASGYAVAQNTDSEIAQANFHLSNPIVIALKDNLVFPDLVAPAFGGMNSTSVSVSSAGVVSYGANSSPNGAGGNNSGSNTIASTGASAGAGAGSITVTGEAGYNFSVSPSVTGTAPGVTLNIDSISTQTIGFDSNTNTNSTSGANASGTSVVYFGGELIANGTAVPASGTQSLAISFVVAYN